MAAISISQLKVGQTLYTAIPVGTITYTVLSVSSDGTTAQLLNPNGTIDVISSGSQLLSLLKVLLPSLPATVGTAALTFTEQADNTYSCPAASQITPPQLYALGQAILSSLKTATGN